MIAAALKLRAVDATATDEDMLRDLIQERDRATAVIKRCDALIGSVGRSYVRARGEFMSPTIERLRRELL